MRVSDRTMLAWPGPASIAATLALFRPALKRLTFEAPDPDVRVSGVRLARLEIEAGAGAPTVLKAANEVAVGEFLERRIGFCCIPAAGRGTNRGGGSDGMLSRAFRRRERARH